MVNVPPVGGDGTVTVTEDVPYTFSPSTLLNASYEPDPDDTIVAVRIDTLPVSGALLLSGVAVSAGDLIATANISNLRYVPPANANGVGLASFTFSVSDGEDFDPTPNTMTIDVTAINDAPTFNVGDGSGITSITLHEIGLSSHLQPDGKLLVAGFTSSGSNQDFAIVRYNVDGSLDASFGTGGIVTTPIGPSDEVAYDIIVDPSGKIVVAGRTFNGSNHDFALVRYNSDGSLDSSFGGGTMAQ